MCKNFSCKWNGNLGAGCLQPNEYAMYLRMYYVSTDTICNSKSQKTGNLISVATLVVNGNLGAGCLQPNEYAMYLCMSSTDLYCALYICFGRGSKKNKRKKKVATRYHVALCCSSNSTAWTPKSVIIWLLFSQFLTRLS